MKNQKVKLVMCMATMLTFLTVGLVINVMSEREPKTEVQTFMRYDYVDVTVGYNDTLWSIVSETLNTDDYTEIQNAIDMMYVDGNKDLINVGDVIKVPVPYEYEMEVVVK